MEVEKVAKYLDKVRASKKVKKINLKKKIVQNAKDDPCPRLSEDVCHRPSVTWLGHTTTQNPEKNIEFCQFFTLLGGSCQPKGWANSLLPC